MLPIAASRSARVPRTCTAQWRRFSPLACLGLLLALGLCATLAAARLVALPAWAHHPDAPAVSSVLTGAHPYHFPVYFERAAGGVAARVTPFERTVMLRWRAKHAAGGVFNYRLGSAKEPLETRALDGGGEVLQAALGRSGKRNMRKPRLRQVSAPMDPEGFTFREAKARELLAVVTLHAAEAAECRTLGRACATVRVPDVSAQDSAAPLREVASLSAEDTVMLVNTNPFGAFHFLLVPEFGRLLPQALTERSMQVALAYASQASGYLKLIFNSIGAGASVNHHHWQGFYMRAPLPIERRGTRPLVDAGTVAAAEVEGWPIRAYVLTSGSQAELAAAAMRVVDKLVEENVAHNLLVCDSGRKVVVVPRSIGWFPDVSKKQVAAMEVLGFWVIPNREEYAGLTAEEAHRFLRAQRPDVAVDVRALVQAASPALPV
eukprot:Rhum_TRINITY_DN14108_c0_g1::Rhum_TRINITY_DN14108_c0_g1_i5::g.69280::m.69280